MQTTQPLNPKLTTLTLFGIRRGFLRWGLAQMGTSPPQLKKVPGLLFYKLLGSGHGRGFSAKPNFYRYGLLCTWESEEAAENFLYRSELMQEYRHHSYEIWTVRMLPFQSHGKWDEQEPFAPLLQDVSADGPVAVLTRASINWRALPEFWRFVPKASKALDDAEGLLCSIGLGELPLVRQATFSVWESTEAMKQYAYRHPQHKEVMQRTRSNNWYSEELFARFRPVASEGNWEGVNPLQQLFSGTENRL